MTDTYEGHCDVDHRVWRVLRGREVESCSNCGDGPYDVYGFDEDDPY